MKMPDGKIIPVPGDTEFKFGEVGISFCYKRTFAVNKKVLFENIKGLVPGLCEDWGLLEKLRINFVRIHMSVHTTYHVMSHKIV
jgi:hypothetical protein